MHKPTKRVVEVLQLISQNEHYSLTDISKELDIPKSTLSPILKTLVDFNLLKQDAKTQRYKIGIASFMIGNNFLNNIDAINIAKTYMKNIVNTCNEICQLGILEQNKVLYIAKIEPSQPIKLDSNVGKSLPANCTALGKMLLSSLDNNLIRELFRDNFPRLTDKSAKDIDTLLSQIEHIRSVGIAHEKGESNAQIVCIAVPVLKNNKIIASISVSTPAFRCTKQLIKKIENSLLAESLKLSKKICNLDLNFL